MEQITILVKDERKAQLLLDLLSSLDFVSALEVENVDDLVEETGDDDSREDEFFAAAGIWKDRDVTLASLRAAAWPRQAP